MFIKKSNILSIPHEGIAKNTSSKYAVFIIFRLGQARPWATTDSSGVLSDHELFPVPLPCSPTHSFSRLSRAIFTPYLSPPSQSKVLFLPLPIPKLLHSTWSHVWPTPTHTPMHDASYSPPPYDGGQLTESKRFINYHFTIAFKSKQILCDTVMWND